MEKDTKQKNTTARNVRKLFDQTLGHHIERLTGSRYGVGSLPINLATISYLIFLTERESEIENFPSAASERYTHETLLNELAEIGIDTDEDLKMELQHMIQKGYIDVDNDGKFSAKKPATSMARLLDRTFPKMPGMNFIAYLIQTMDEAQSGRKDLDYAISQFDQTLQMQRVSLLKQEAQPKPKKVPRPHVGRKIKLGKIETSQISRSGSKIISSKGETKKVEIKELSAWQDESIEPSPEMDEAIEVQESDIPQEENKEEQDEKVETEIFYVEPNVPPERLSDISPEPSSEMQGLTVETASPDTSIEDVPSSKEAPPTVLKTVVEETDLSEKLDMVDVEAKSVKADEVLQQEETKHETEMVLERRSLEKDDDIIEKQIASLEEGLAMQCPICKTGKIQEEMTGTNKTFYRCSNKDCNFISWGKPFHIVCPQCNNPFLVEIFDRGGKTILKCPRATCRYWQKLPGEMTEEPQNKADSKGQEPVKSTVISQKPRRRVVRRRVVRRKR